jgi:2-keto-4-pentenoate hydratase/2-oxohepta-3-ene-1,7-dioic acid hydratase in catechol pathway
MRFIRFITRDRRTHLGVKDGDVYVDLTSAEQERSGKSLLSVTDLMKQSVPLDHVSELLQFSSAQSDNFSAVPGAVELDAPIRDAPKLIALAGNFRKHVVESGFSAISEDETITPQVFLKPPSTTINAPYGRIRLRDKNRFLDWEVELAVIIGKRGRDIHADSAMDYVFGFSVINDISERELNAEMTGRKVREFDPFFDWLLGKWFDGSAPLGPEIVTRDEVADPHNLDLRLKLNGECMQSGNTSHMIFDVPQTIEYVSSVFTLEPGDVIAMGTPDGVGKARGIRLKPGDVIEAEIPAIGVLRTEVV